MLPISLVLFESVNFCCSKFCQFDFCFPLSILIFCAVDLSVCEGNPCNEGGECTTTDGINPICTCHEFYTGRLCETYQSPCRSLPCTNEGTCVDQGPGFTCSCPSTYQGNCNYRALVSKLVWSGGNEKCYQFPSQAAA